MIQTYNVSKVYDHGDRPALRDVSLFVEKGEFVFLTGPSGAGKSTLLKLLFLAERPTKGQVVVNGRNVAALHRRHIPFHRREIGVVFQDFKLIQNRTVHENVAYTLHVLGRPEREIRKRVYTILSSVGLVHRAHALPVWLSGGEQQRVAIARALVGEPVVLLADEPTGNLDAEITEEVMEILEQANARGTTVVVATHDKGLLRRYRKRIIYLKDGKVVTSASAFIDPRSEDLHSATVPDFPRPKSLG